jgi:hypothetical protein
MVAAKSLRIRARIDSHVLFEKSTIPPKTMTVTFRVSQLEEDMNSIRDQGDVFVSVSKSAWNRSFSLPTKGLVELRYLWAILQKIENVP